jgi:predicted O-linked N-acetylglucosamine transferase (SPINDLY family)
MDDAPKPDVRTEPGPDALVQDALRLRQEGDLEAAGACFRQALALDPGHFAALYLYGELRLRMGEPAAAEELLEQSLFANRGSAVAHAALAQALWQQDRPDEALYHLDRAERLQPDSEEVMLNRGIVLQQQGRPEEALASLDRALALNPGNAAALSSRGLALLQLKRAEEALAGFDRALAQSPGLAQAHRGRGAALWELRRLEEALASFEQALGIEESADSHKDRAKILLDLDRPLEALSSYERGLALSPDDPDALRYRGNTLMELKRPQEALASYERALEVAPGNPDTLLACGNALLVLGRSLEALDSYDRALTAQPGRADATLNRGNALARLGRPLEALAAFDLALERQPGWASALANRALALLALKRAGEALDSADRALALEPEHLEGVINRGMTLLDLKRPSEALDCFDRALALRPDHLDAWMNRGTALHILGRHREAMVSYDRALSIRPDHAGCHSNKIFVQDFLPELSFEEHQLERRRYWEAQAASIPPPAAHPNDRDPDRRLVLGYVSADFKHHSAASCFGPVLRRHDRAGFRVVCYSGVQTEDDWTREFRQLADAWRPIAGMTDAAVAEQVRADRVDILIDLSGHSKGNRLPVFARKPAPVQVTAWGHGGGTGVPAVDCLFTDPVLIPERVRPLFAESCIDLPCCITFEAPAVAPEIRGLPGRTRGHVTFGCLNRSSKVSQAALELWARILVRVPGSRLLLKDIMLEDPEVRRQILEALARLDIGPGRVELRGATSRQEHLDAYNEVDIVLDTIPQNGGIATWEALWMGAPVVAMLGQNLASRLSGAILQSLGLGGWVAEREADYEEFAVCRAGDLDALARFRAGIRAAILASDAGNPERYTRAVEAAYRTLWKRWCSA